MEIVDRPLRQFDFILTKAVISSAKIIIFLFTPCLSLKFLHVTHEIETVKTKIKEDFKVRKNNHVALLFCKLPYT
jgi:putative lipoprotein